MIRPIQFCLQLFPKSYQFWEHQIPLFGKPKFSDSERQTLGSRQRFEKCWASMWMQWASAWFTRLNPHWKFKFPWKWCSNNPSATNLEECKELCNISSKVCNVKEFMLFKLCNLCKNFNRSLPKKKKKKSWSDFPRMGQGLWYQCSHETNVS